jgi:H2-forming N5,N10-methylenetetrahydromethanopterin dehydrogenase-like enzyme
MRFSPLSFALGLVAASLLPALSRVFRPFAVEAAAAGMGMFDDARRFASEQLETLEDIVAEAKVRREHLDAAAVVAAAEMAEPEAEEAAGRARRRSNGAGRRRAAADAGR